MYSAGDKIVHPLHGAGVIERIEMRTVSGEERRYCVLHIAAGSVQVSLPVDSMGSVGVRRVIAAEDAERVLLEMSQLDADMNQNWNRRYRENLLRMKSGDVMELARVIKGLTERDCQHGLSTGEKKMLRSARQILISELVVSENATYEEMESRVNEALA